MGKPLFLVIRPSSGRLAIDDIVVSITTPDSVDLTQVEGVYSNMQLAVAQGTRLLRLRQALEANGNRFQCPTCRTISGARFVCVVCKQRRCHSAECGVAHAHPVRRC